MPYNIERPLNMFKYRDTNHYFSQDGQDKYVAEIFNYNENGVFVDIGANDGITFSNTYFLEKKLNWKGVCVEPMAQAFEKLRAVRNAVLVNGCATPINGKKTFLSVEGYGEMLSGIKENYDARHLQRLYRDVEEHGGTVSEIIVNCYSINDILNANALYEIDYLSIDTEGGESDLIKAIDFSTFYIKSITVENPFKESGINSFLQSRDFEQVAFLGADEIYLNKKAFSYLSRKCLKHFKRYIDKVENLVSHRSVRNNNSIA